MNKKKELTPYEKAIRSRIINLINEYCDGSQQRFVERTGLNKGSVSTYVNGKNTPSWENAEKIANAFNIEVDWVMATDILPSDVPSDEDKELINLFHSVDPGVRESVMTLLRYSKREL